jgi:hypothetical protein
MELCPVCRHRDATCKIRMLHGQTLFSCQSCFEAEERKRPARESAPRDYWGHREPDLLEPPKFLKEALTNRES